MAEKKARKNSGPRAKDGVIVGEKGTWMPIALASTEFGISISSLHGLVRGEMLKAQKVFGHRSLYVEKGALKEALQASEAVLESDL